MTQVQEKPAVLQAIYERRSVRHFQDAPVERGQVMEALRAASWAPSGLNNQPWRFALVWDPELRNTLAGLTRYAATLKAAAVLIPVFLDKESSYDYVKDCQAVGAALQNLLLACHAQGLGAVWIGEILKNKEKVREALGLPERLELMAVVAVGHPAHTKQSSHRRPLEELIVFDR
ncbi:Nitroreductase [Desulfacinum infernum DSM 9756]|uniref:Nitroreductase n=1 Tax=Desulfacinum infernum DSM 9756 TaxID=1121391 RepID=A0A1M4SSG7_9BACT|nr:nitroreductase [Desulfacinum infernum]SHE35126.1 Nitroreductase [Desulfacinum infernum DSM 9756]